MSSSSSSSSPQTRKISSGDRKGVQSLFIPAVPQIVLNADEKADTNSTSTIPHSRSAGELATCMTGGSGASSKSSSGHALDCNGKEAEPRNVIDIYCSPRLPRRSFHQYGNHNSHCDDDSNWLESYDPNTLPAKLGPGSRVGSAVSLTSEYTARSVGLISNDSSSDSTQFSDKLEMIKQKQSLLRRYVSNPEKPNDIYEHQVQRCTKSVNNLHNECGQQLFVNQSNSSTEGSFADLGSLGGVERDLTKVRTDYAESDDGFSSSMVTMVTDELAVKEGRVRQWLTEMGSTNE